MKKYSLLRPGVSLLDSDSRIVTPVYPFRFTKPKVGDKVYIIATNKKDWCIDTDIIASISDFYEEAKRQHKFNKKNPKPGRKQDYLIDFWLTKYNNGHGNSFGETIFSSFEEARSVFVQYYASDYKEYNKILACSEKDLRPK